MCKHEWRLTVGHSECKECHYSSIEGVAACVHCDESIGPTEIERRLNATEMLSAGAADYAAEFTQAGTNTHSMDQESEGNIYYLTDALRAYASALEGK